MGIITLIALWYGRKPQITIALVLTAFLMTVWNPKILVYDVGFQLSFAATCGLVYASPKLERYFKWAPQKLAIRESLLLTISAQIFALPIIMFSFGRFAWVSPISNLLVAPFIPLSMLFGAISVVVFPLFEFIGRLIGFAAWLFMEVVILVAEGCGLI
jgi:competence protein ComEC